MLNVLDLYSCHGYFILLHKPEKHASEIKEWTFKIYLLTGEPSSWFPLMNHKTRLVPDPMCGSGIFVNLREFRLFFVA